MRAIGDHIRGALAQAVQMPRIRARGERRPLLEGQFVSGTGNCVHVRGIA